MDPLFCDSEPFSPRGAIAAEGISRILGTPSLDRLQVLVRETVQNSTDASLLGEYDTTVFGMSLRVLTRPQKKFLRSTIFRNLPPQQNDRALECSLKKRRLWVLDIYDKGATGLDGPTAADTAVREGEPRNFIDFVRNIGSRRDTEKGGGTYGFGKSVLFANSNCKTICVHTRCKTKETNTESRFISYRIGASFSCDGATFTGRHYWGRPSDDGTFAEPLRSGEADEAAKLIGMDERDPDCTGTTIQILDPDFGDKSPEQVMASLQEAVLWYCWPKMVGLDNAKPELDCEFFLNGEQLPPIAPEKFPPLGPYIEAMKKVGVEDSNRREIKCLKPKMSLGYLAIDRAGRRPRIPLDTGNEKRLVPEFSHHIALMRPCKLVVRYEEGPRLSTDTIEYGGVFIVGGEVEEVFANSEPPAHDDWISDYLQGREKTFVNVALRNIKAQIHEEIVGSPRSDDKTGHHPSLARLGDHLGQLLSSEGPRLGGTSGMKSQTNSKTGQTAGPTIGPVVAGDLLSKRNGTVREFTFSVQAGSDGSAYKLLAKPLVAIDTGEQVVSLEHGDAPVIRYWRIPGKDSQPRGTSVQFTKENDGDVIVGVSVPSSMAIWLKIEKARD